MVLLTFYLVTPSNFRMIEATIADAEYYYNNELTPSERAEVVNYNDLVMSRAHFNKLNNSALIAEFTQGVANLPDSANLKNENVTQVYEMKELMDNNKSLFSANVENFAPLEAKVTSCYNRIVESMREYAYISQDLNADGIVTTDELSQNKTRTDTEYSIFKIIGSYGSVTAQSCQYSDILNSTPISLTKVFKGAVEFNATTAGTLTYYPRNYNRTYIVTLNGKQIGEPFKADMGGLVELEIPSAGTVKITTTTGDANAAFYAVKFNYPNLG